MEGNFDTTGQAPSGWIHAVFHGGPYGEDVGRCVPGPPAPQTLAVPLPEGGIHVYRLWRVGSWSGSNGLVAVYNPDGPPVPPPLLSDQEEAWLQDKQRDRGLEPVRTVALKEGLIENDPGHLAVEAMLAGLRSRKHLLLQRLTDRTEDDEYIQVLLREDKSYEVEHHAGVLGHRRARTTSQTEVRNALLGWTADRKGWQAALQWTGIDHPGQASSRHVPEHITTGVHDRPDRA
ncbi:hypothetical protein [Streptomyces sp. WAC08241]|uniref:hypothetical protein n=1 Tax=Streptomyces sp. WAC08241 TaxID=2487421 RepID=UPI000F7936F0|nr:hypothetical protein [Streptomyces sp. WAC08241]RSS42593.1 hypothetical protein EF906_11810 [Streptomyces sp. WAC08241]